MTRTMILSLLLASAFTSVFLALGSARAYERYKVPGTDAGNCSTCHGDFTDGTSPKGTVFPSNDKHTMHRSKSHMNADCDLCHTSGDQKNPFIGSSDGTDDNPGLGCVGCHGRVEDAGHDGRLPGLGAGLRQHHFYGGAMICGQCHLDSSSMIYTPVGEDVLPTYYGTVDTNVDDPCNAIAAAETNENWSNDALYIGLDNDGDLAYDADDVVDCPEPAEVLLAAVGAVVLGGLSRRRKR